MTDEGYYRTSTGMLNVMDGLLDHYIVKHSNYAEMEYKAALSNFTKKLYSLEKEHNLPCVYDVVEKPKQCKSKDDCVTCWLSYVKIPKEQT